MSAFSDAVGTAVNTLFPDAASGTIPVAMPFIVFEQTGDKRIVVLTGRALPYRDLTFETEHQIETTAYPGSPVLSAQPLGAREKETTVHGMWKDKFLTDVNPTGALDLSHPVASSDGVALRSAKDIANIFNDICRKGQLVKVTWGPFVRLGFVHKFKHSWPYITDVKWEITFLWISQGDPNVGGSFGQQLDQGQTLGSIDSALSKVKGALDTVQGAIATAQDAVDTILSKIDKIDSLVKEAGDVVGSAIDLINTPDVAAQRLAALWGNVKDACEDLSDTIQATPTTAILASSASAVGSTVVATASGAGGSSGTGGSSGGGSVAPSATSGAALQAKASVNAASFLQAATLKRSLLRTLRGMRYTAAKAAALTTSQALAPEIIAQFKVRVNTDLRMLSSLYYGTPEDWRALGIFNGIQGTLVPMGTLINIPRSPPRTTGTIEFGASALAPGP